MTPQQKKILTLLSDGLWYTTKEITDATGIGYPPRRIHELRKAGHNIVGERSEHWERYRLDKPLAAPSTPDTLPVASAPSTPPRLGFHLSPPRYD